MTAVRVALAALVIGGLYAINSWDLPTFAAIYVGAAALPTLLAGRAIQRREWVTAGLFAVGCLLLYAPFHARFTSLVGGQPFDLPEPLASIPLIPKISSLLGVVLWRKTPADQFFTVYALPWVVALLFLTWRWSEGRKATAARGYTQPILIILVLALAATILQMPILLLAGLLLLLVGAIFRQRRAPRPNGPGQGDADLFAIALIGAAFALVLATEVFFIHDIFANRMNTVFKVYYQAWTLLAVAAGYAIVRLLTFRPRRRADLWRLPASGAVALLLIATLAYPIFGSRARTDDFSVRSGLDGLAFVRDAEPAEWAGITWVRDHVPAGAVVAEAPGCSYGELFGMPHDRVSAFAGVSTPLGWAGHESQWRGGSPALLAALGPRAADINTLYSTTDPAEAQAIMDRYHIQYVYVGTFERHGYSQGGIGADCTAGGNYPPAGLAKFDTMLDRVFTSDDGAVAVYARRE
jgi:YYY domain-containing protein